MNKEIPHNITPENESISESLHLIDYLDIIRRRKWFLITFVLVVVFIVTVKSFSTIPLYKATTQIILEKKPIYDVEMQGGVAGVPLSTRGGSLETQYDLLKSRTLALKVVEQLELTKVFESYKEEDSKNRHYFEKVYTSISSKVKNLFKDVFSLILSTFEYDGGHSTEIGDKQLKGLGGELTSLDIKKEKAVNRYLSNLEILPVKKSLLVNITYTDRSPGLASLIANTHAPAFIERNFEIQQSTSQQALKWITEQLEEEHSKVQASKKAAYDYRKAQNIVSLEERQNIINQKLMQLNSGLTIANNARIEKQSIYEHLKQFPNDKEKFFSLPEVAGNSGIQELRREWIDLKAQRDAGGYKPKHPELIDLNSEIKKIEEKITSEMQRLTDTIKVDLSRAKAYEKSIEKSLNEQKQLTLSLNEKAIDYSMLVGEAESNQRVYDMLLKQSKEISLTSVLESSNVRIVDKANIPRSPFKPKISDNILLSVVLGIFIGTGLVFFFEYMDDSVKTPEDVRKLIGMAALSSIPYDKTLKRSKTKALKYLKSYNNQQQKIGSHYSPYDSKNYFLTGLKVMQQRNPGISFLVQSATSGEGKTTVLAKSSLDLAQGGLNVVVVDADLVRSDLDKTLGFNGNGSGLLTAMSSVLSQKIYQGNLQDYSVSDLFSIISFKKQSGQLIVNNGSDGMRLTFKKGRLFHIQSEEKILANSLGTMLLRAGSIDESQLSDALERNERTGQPLGYILINCGYVKQEQLRGHLKLQAEENIQRLFGWNCGTFRFDLGHVERYENERIYFEDDYTPIINHLESKVASRFLESVLLSNVHRDIKPNLSLLSTGKSPTMSDTVYFAILEKFLNILKQNFDIVFVDSCPVIDAGGASPLTAMVDGVIFVIKQGSVSIKTVNEAKTSLKNADAKILGAILNQVKKGPAKYGKY